MVWHERWSELTYYTYYVIRAVRSCSQIHKEIAWFIYTYMHVCVNTPSLNSSRLRMREAPFLEVTNLSKGLMRLTSWKAISAVSEKNPYNVHYAISEGRGPCEVYLAFNFILKSKTIYYTFRWWLNRSRWLLVELELLLCFSSSGLFSGTGCYLIPLLAWVFIVFFVVSNRDEENLAHPGEILY